MKSIFSNVLTPAQIRQMKYVGIHRMIKPRLNFTGLERKYYSMLKDLNIFYVPQYKMGGRYYDAFLPDQNILLEFDGAFWHKTKEEDCKYDFQRKNMEADKLKDRMAQENGMKIIRIREDSSITQAQLRKLIWD